jgi:glycosyltransferase involved in cell wall biosynthesis
MFIFDIKNIKDIFVFTRLVLYAPNVHTGGGLVLLSALLKNWPRTVELVALLDVRARDRIVVPVGVVVTWVYPRFHSRAMAEIILCKLSGDGINILCFHGLPPLLPNKSRVIVFLQNRLYIESVSWGQYRWWTRLRLSVERFVSRVFRHRVSEYIVQTPSMKRAVLHWYGVRGPGQPEVRVLPFVVAQHSPPEQNGTAPVWDFVYIADGEAHKNHRTLLAAWQLLARDGLHPSLALTLSMRDMTLKQELAALTDTAGLRIKDLGHMPHENVLSLYATARAMIFPSTSESFGLPLIEATNAGLPILASELDFVRDVCSPVQTFDPTSPVSIARAVKRFLAVPEPVLQLRSPQEFWRELLGAASE